LNLDNVLSLRTYIAKLIGLIAILMSGFSVGKEGPFIHLSAIIADNLPYKLSK
jgi:H+/Cl- antiporter ClcA